MTTTLRARVMEALSTLPAEQRQALELRERLGHDYAQIAAEIGRSVSEVESLLLHGRWRFRRSVEALCVPSSGETGCDWVLARLAAAIDGELSPAKQAGIAQHVRVCDPCRSALYDLQGTSALYALSLREDGLALQGDRVAPREEPSTGRSPAVDPHSQPPAPTPDAPGSAIHRGQWRRAALLAAALTLVLGGSAWLAQRLPTGPAQAAAGATLGPTATAPRSTPALAVVHGQPPLFTSTADPQPPGLTDPHPAPAESGVRAASVNLTPSTPAPLSPQGLAGADPTEEPGAVEPTPEPGAGDRAVVRGEGAAGTWSLVPSVPLNVRAQPSSAAERLEVLAPGQPLQLMGGPVLTEEADFYLVGLPGGLQGWVAPPPEDIPESARRAWLEKRQLRVRPAPEADGIPVRVGTLVRVLAWTGTAEHGAWAQVRLLASSSSDETEGFLPAGELAPISQP